MSQAVENSGTKTLLAGAAISAYRRVRFDGTSVVHAVAGEHWDGTAMASADSAAYVAVRLRSVPGTRFMIAAAAISAGATVYGAAAGKISTVAVGEPVGVAMQAASGDGSRIEVETWPMGYSQLLSAAVAASTAVSNTTTETSFGVTKTIPAGSLKAGDVITIFGQVIATATNSTDTLLIKAYIGSTAYFTSATLDVANNDICVWRAELVVRTIGASGTVVGAGFGIIGPPASATTKQFNLASTTIDTTVDITLDVKATWSVASASNSCRLDIHNVRHERAAG